MKKVIGLILICIGLVFAIYILRAVEHSRRNHETEIETTTSVTETSTASTDSNLTEEDIERIVSKMLEKQTEVTTAETTTAETTSISGTETEAETEETTSSATDVSTNETTVDGCVTFIHSNENVTANTYSSKYEAAFFSVMFKEDGRNVTIKLNEEISSASVAVSFRDTSDSWSKLSNFETLKFTSNNGTSEMTYTIPDNEFRKYNDSIVVFTAVVKVTDTNGTERYFSFSY